MESSMMFFEEHHKWKVITWLVGSSLGFPSNLGMSEGNLVGILGQVASCKMGSFMSLVKSGMLRDVKYGKGIFGGGLSLAIVCVGDGHVSLEGFGVLYFFLEKMFSPRLLVKENQ
jgi:hypothetical protein